MKRKLSLLLAVVMILGSFSFVLAEENDAELAAGEFLMEQGVVEGINGELKLEDNLRRQDMVVMVSRLMGAEEEAEEFPTEELTFTDFKDPYYRPIIAWAVANELIEGHSPERFGFNEDVTAQQYATVLLRALGYGEEVAGEGYDDALELAQELGLVGEDVENDTVVTRGYMYVMTVQALSTPMKDSEELLADKLGVEFPEPEVLEVDNVYADNLMEVKVVFNKDVEDDLVDVELYDTNAGAVKDAFVEDGNVLVLVLDEEMDNNGKYKLTVAGTEDVDGVYEFEAYDNIIPEVVDVVALGTKAVKVVMSEPVDPDSVSRNKFKLDGNSFFGALNVSGREIVLQPYGDVLTVGEHELVVGKLEDFAEYKSVETKVVFEVLLDDVKPEVVDISGTTERLVVTFSEDIDPDSVNNDTLYWDKDSNTGVANQLAGNKWAFEFDKSLPSYEVTVYVQGAKDYSGNEMDEHKELFTGELDEVRPEVKDAYVDEDEYGLDVIVVEFTKALYKDDVEDESNFTLVDEDDDKVEIEETEFADGSNKVVKVKLYRDLVKGEEYTLKVSGVRDNSKLRNSMLPFEGTIFVDKDASTAKAELAGVNVDELKIFVAFGKKMDLATIADMSNYLVEVEDSLKLLSGIKKADIDVVDNGKGVVITLPGTEDGVYELGTKVTGVAVLQVKDTDGKVLSNPGEVLKIVDGNGDLIKAELNIVEVTAKSPTKLVVEFSQAIVDAKVAYFEITGENVKVKKVVVDGSEEVVLEVDELKADVSGYGLRVKKDIKSVVGVKADNDLVYAGEFEDEIAPSLKDVEATTTSTTTQGTINITLTFDEDISATNEDYADRDITIRELRTGKTLKASDFKVEEVSEKEIKVKIVVEDELFAGKVLRDLRFGVSLKDPKYIEDMNENLANKAKEKVANVVAQ